MFCRYISLLIAMVPYIFVTACETPKKPFTLVHPGKADNYYSPRASEFEIGGFVTVQMTDAEHADPIIRQQKIDERSTAAVLYLSAFLSQKVKGVDIDSDGEVGEDEIFYPNHTYGGFYTTVRNPTLRTVEFFKIDEQTYNLQFEVIVAGPHHLLDLLPTLDGGDRQPDDGRFIFKMRKQAMATEEDTAILRDFDANTYEGDLEEIICWSRKLQAPQDSYPAFDSFVSDGILDITIWLGYDYTAGRTDLLEGCTIFETMKDRGFSHPAESCHNLTANSPPLTKQYRIDDERVFQIEIRLFHSDMFLDSRDHQRQLALSEMAQRDIFIYSGHGGPYYGLSLAPNGEVHLEKSDIEKVTFTEKQQLFVAGGCKTYSQYAELFYAHPLKNENNLDVITAVNFSNGTAAILLVQLFSHSDPSGHHYVMPYSSLLSEMNKYTTLTFFGVTGIDDNRKLHPYARIDRIGQSCWSDEDCGNPGGNVCGYMPEALADDLPQCMAFALDISDCPPGSFGMHIVSWEGDLMGATCVGTGG